MLPMKADLKSQVGFYGQNTPSPTSTYNYAEIRESAQGNLS